MVGYVAALVLRVRALLTLLCELCAGSRTLGRERLSVRTKGVDRQLLNSDKGRVLKAFVDGSVLAHEDGAPCGFAVFYADEHPLNFHGRIDLGRGPPAQSNLTELAALYWALWQHPRGQQLSIFSDSAHALRVVQSVSGEPPDAQQCKRARRAHASDSGGSARLPKLDAREAALALAIAWLLRLRTARTCFYKVAAHRGFRQNQLADALAQAGARHGPACQLPLRATLWSLALLLMSYLLAQSELDGGLGGGGGGGGDEGVGAADAEGARERRRRAQLRRPQPIGPSTEVTPLLALDCEMVGVGPFGMESSLASVSVVNAEGNQVFFSYAKPTRTITDYRTRYSGIERHHLEGAPSVAAVQQQVRSLVEGRIVVGHSLENDFRVLGFSPPRVRMRDTAHDVRRLLTRSGRPRKLRRIAWEFLGIVIQDSEAGHDPLEDARAALLLYLRFRDEFEARAAHHAAEAAAREQASAAKAKAT